MPLTGERGSRNVKWQVGSGEWKVYVEAEAAPAMACLLPKNKKK